MLVHIEDEQVVIRLGLRGGMKLRQQKGQSESGFLECYHAIDPARTVPGGDVYGPPRRAVKAENTKPR